MGSEERVRNGVKRLLKNRKQTTQGRLDSFFKPIAKDSSHVKALVAKRKVDAYDLSNGEQYGIRMKGRMPKPTKRVKQFVYQSKLSLWFWSRGSFHYLAEYLSSSISFFMLVVRVVLFIHIVKDVLFILVVRVVLFILVVRVVNYSFDID